DLGEAGGAEVVTWWSQSWLLLIQADAGVVLQWDLEQTQVGVGIGIARTLLRQSAQDLSRSRPALLPDDPDLPVGVDDVGAGENLARAHEEASAGVLPPDQDLNQAALEVVLEGVARATRRGGHRPAPRRWWARRPGRRSPYPPPCRSLGAAALPH